MIKRILTIAALLSAVLIGILLYFLSSNGFIRLINKNEITVTADKQLSSDKVKIEFGFNSINRFSDLEMITSRENLTTLYSKWSTKSVPTDFGENDFLLTYDDKYYLSFRQYIQTDFKGGYPRDNKYCFYFYLNDGRPHVKVEISGDSPMLFDHPMIDMGLAAKYRCNIPIDMIDLEKNEYK